MILVQIHSNDPQLFSPIGPRPRESEMSLLRRDGVFNHDMLSGERSAEDIFSAGMLISRRAIIRFACVASVGAQRLSVLSATTICDVA
jgi:hypothetical protein